MFFFVFRNQLQCEWGTFFYRMKKKKSILGPLIIESRKHNTTVRFWEKHWLRFEKGRKTGPFSTQLSFLFRWNCTRLWFSSDLFHFWKLWEFSDRQDSSICFLVKSLKITFLFLLWKKFQIFIVNNFVIFKWNWTNFWHFKIK